jgi:hypothetical protein
VQSERQRNSNYGEKWRHPAPARSTRTYAAHGFSPVHRCLQQVKAEEGEKYRFILDETKHGARRTRAANEASFFFSEPQQRLHRNVEELLVLLRRGRDEYSKCSSHVPDFSLAISQFPICKMTSKQTFPRELILVGGIPDEPLHSDVDAICSSPGPTAFFKELYSSVGGSALTAFERLGEERTEDYLKIRAWSGTPTVGLEWLEEKCLETSLIPVSIECITHGLPAMKVRWNFMLEYAGQLGHAAFRHLSLIAQFENERALKEFHEVWSKVFKRKPVFQGNPDSPEPVTQLLDQIEHLLAELQKNVTIISEYGRTGEKEFSLINEVHESLKRILSSAPQELTRDELDRCANFQDRPYKVNYYYTPGNCSQDGVEELPFADIRELARKEIGKRKS